MIVILSYFHTRIGTSVFYSFPETPLDKEITVRLYDIMTQQNEEEFFIHSFKNLKILNFYYQIPSEWARGKKEMVMISIIINQQISLEIEESISLLCKNFSEKMQFNEEIYTGFYTYELNKHDEIDKKRIIENENLIKQSVQDLYWEIVEETRKKSEEQKITLLLNDRYIFESLEKMSRELKIISREINSYENPPKANSNIKNSISNLNKIIDDLYEGFIEKMSSLDLENQEDLFPPDEEMDVEIKKSKEELLQVLQGEIDGEED
ncbi:MAG: hypothetical protein ACFE94_17575 [Candidatus Hodarchaeota archaeon]